MQAMQHFENNTIVKSNRYQVSLPFSETPPPVKNNYVQALRCLESSEQRRAKNGSLDKAYKKAMNEYFDNGHAHVVPPWEATKSTDVFYLPHSSVINESLILKSVRIVFNASAIFQGSSLYEFTLVGPKLQKYIVDILTKVRSKPIVVAGDISKMFLQIKIAPKDQDYVRFIWREDPTQSVQICRFSSLVFGLASLPFWQMP